MIKLFRSPLIALTILVVVLTACSLTPTDSESDRPQTCPAWAGYDEGKQCLLRLWKYGVTVSDGAQTVLLKDWEKIRFTVIGGEVLINDVVNVTVRPEVGAPIDTKSTRLQPGSYIAERADDSKEGSFKIQNPHGEASVNVSGEFVRPAK